MDGAAEHNILKLVVRWCSWNKLQGDIVVKQFLHKTTVIFFGRIYCDFVCKPTCKLSIGLTVSIATKFALKLEKYDIPMKVQKNSQNIPQMIQLVIVLVASFLYEPVYLEKCF